MQVIGLADGRRVSLERYGCRGGLPVLALHGTPGSHLKFASGEAEAAACGVELLAVDRWGYGATDAPATPSLARYAADAGELADRLGLDRFSVLGISGGGPFATAVAAGLGDRVAAAALVSPVGPVADASPLRLDPIHAVAFRLLPHLPRTTAALFHVLRLVARHRPQAAARLAAGRARPCDRDILDGGTCANDLGRSFALGMAGGVRGAVIDVQLFGRPWAIDWAGVTAPCRIWIGDDDRNVPIAAAVDLASRLQAAGAATELTRLAGAGHYWIVDNFGDVCRWLAANQRR